MKFHDPVKAAVEEQAEVLVEERFMLFDSISTLLPTEVSYRRSSAQDRKKDKQDK